MVNVLKFRPKRPRQTGQTQIRLLLNTLYSSSLLCPTSNRKQLYTIQKDKKFANSRPDLVDTKIWEHSVLFFIAWPTLQDNYTQFGKCSIISNTSCLPKGPRQTGQTQIRLLLQKQSGQGIPCLLFWQENCKFQHWSGWHQDWGTLCTLLHCFAHLPIEHRGSFMNAHILLNLLNKLGKEIKCEACRAFYLFFATSLINSIIQ